MQSEEFTTIFKGADDPQKEPAGAARVEYAASVRGVCGINFP